MGLDFFYLFVFVVCALLTILVVVVYREQKRRKDAKAHAAAHAGSVVDFDQDLIPLDDLTDATSLLLNLSMKHGVGCMTWDNHHDQWLLNFGDREFTGQTQMEALLKAKGALG